MSDTPSPLPSVVESSKSPSSSDRVSLERETFVAKMKDVLRDWHDRRAERDVFDPSPAALSLGSVTIDSASLSLTESYGSSASRYVSVSALPTGGDVVYVVSSLWDAHFGSSSEGVGLVSDGSSLESGAIGSAYDDFFLISGFLGSSSSSVSLGDGDDMIRFDGVSREGTHLGSVLLGGGDDVAVSHASIRIDGGDGNDLIRSGRGDDVVDGGSGSDVVSGGRGDDVLLGGSGDDFLRGSRGSDRLEGGDGGDDLSGGSGDDVLYGGSGEDSLLGGRGDDVLEGGADGDLLRGGKGDDVLRGGSGDDTLLDGRGDDVLEGGSGDDVLYLRSGNDVASGGSGGDVFVFEGSRTGGEKTLRDFESGRDAIALSGFFSGGESVGLSAIDSALSGAESFDADSDGSSDDVRFSIEGDGWSVSLVVLDGVGLSVFDFDLL